VHEFSIIDQRDLYVNIENFIEYKKKLNNYFVKVQKILFYIFHNLRIDYHRMIPDKDHLMILVNKENIVLNIEIGIGYSPPSKSVHIMICGYIDLI